MALANHDTLDCASPHILEKLDTIGDQAGVYLMKDDHEQILYIGKARNLKKRLVNYFKSTRKLDLKTQALVKKIQTFETILTQTEKEALILEATLIKRHRPRYNVVLKDDKRYPLLRLDMKETYPGLTIVRKMKKDGALYFGPYSSSQAVRKTLKLIQRHFRLRQCKTHVFKNRSRPCLNYQMGMCLGMCWKQIPPSVYSETVKEVIMFLRGQTDILIRNIREDMEKASEIEDFEKAAVLRDKLFAIERTIEKQHSVTTDFSDRDVIAVSGTQAHYLITIMTIRRGALFGTHHYSVNETFSTQAEVIRAFIISHYEPIDFIPKEIIVSDLFEDSDLLEEMLREQKGKAVTILSPQKGEKLKLLELAQKNAEKELAERLTIAASNNDMLLRLKARMQLPSLPLRIECIDNSNILGSNPVSAIVVFENGKPLLSGYRKYSVRSIEGPDDYGTMAEVLKRRFGKDRHIPFPDLLIVDGGRGQLSVTLSVIAELALPKTFALAAIAKKNEAIGEIQDKIFVPGRSNPINFNRNGDLLLFLMRIRDEAHRFALSFHRKKRGTTSLSSALDLISGIGKKRKSLLISHFGGVKKIAEAEIEDLCKLPGITIKIAEDIKKVLNRSKKRS